MPSTKTSHAQQHESSDRENASVIKSARLDMSVRIAKQLRSVPITLTGLEPGAVFSGQQKSGRSHYEVNVEILSVDLAKSEMCGYLKIKGLTEEFPELITFFEAEMIGDKHSFITGKWDADESVDAQHWSKFPSFAAQHSPRKPLSSIKTDPVKSEHIYMRWKEAFLVPHWKVKSINGASFAGFYYVCFDRKRLAFDGFYYHRNSEWFQQIRLGLQTERATSAFEFR